MKAEGDAIRELANTIPEESRLSFYKWADIHLADLVRIGEHSMSGRVTTVFPLSRDKGIVVFGARREFSEFRSFAGSFQSEKMGQSSIPKIPLSDLEFLRLANLAVTCAPSGSAVCLVVSETDFCILATATAEIGEIVLGQYGFDSSDVVHLNVS